MDCEYAFDDDSECGGPTCELEKGHAGDHVVTWSTRPIDICMAQGHLWDLWQTYVAPEPPPFLNVWEETPTRERVCLRCDRRDYDGGKRNPDISDVMMAMRSGVSPITGNFLGAIDVASGSHSRPQTITWIEDRLAPRPWRPE